MRSSELQHRDAKEKIYNQLQNAGYSLLGVGEDATVWAKDEASVIKIIMPAGGQDLSGATETFYRFYEFCQQYRDLDCLPRFTLISHGRHHEQFELDGKKYIMVGMERLNPIPHGSISQALVWIMSDLATHKLSWERAFALMKQPKTWKYWGEEGTVGYQDVIKYLKGIDAHTAANYGVLFTVMVLLYHTGRINHQGWDLHTENVMQRSNGTLVITDPWMSLRTGD